jgi:hypothetical protein
MRVFFLSDVHGPPHKALFAGLAGFVGQNLGHFHGAAHGHRISARARAFLRGLAPSQYTLPAAKHAHEHDGCMPAKQPLVMPLRRAEQVGLWTLGQLTEGRAQHLVAGECHIASALVHAQVCHYQYCPAHMFMCSHHF